MIGQVPILHRPADRDGDRELKAAARDRASDADAVREHHSHGESYHPPAAPDVVCFPHTTEEVAGDRRRSAPRIGVPVIPFGAGTSLEGHVHALRGGITIDLREMNRVLRVSAEDLDATVEAGVTRLQLDKALRNTGLMFSVDPGADATIGGMAATRASGTTAVRYGTMRENVLGLDRRARGRPRHHHGNARAQVVGRLRPDAPVRRSEGTLGVITEVTVRLHPVPEAVSAAVCAFDSIEGAVDDGDRDDPARHSGRAHRAARRGPDGRGESLLEDGLSGRADAVLRVSQRQRSATSPTRREAVEALAAEHGGRGFQWATRLEDRERLWQARHDALYAALALRPGARAWITDVCVPISRLAECIIETKQDNAAAPFPISLVGHAGDGNFHLDLHRRSGAARASWRRRGG